MFCSNCGNKIKEGAKSCLNCGGVAQQRFTDNFKKSDDAILKTACIITTVIEAIVLLIIVIAAMPFIVSSLSIMPTIRGAIFSLLLVVVPIIFIIFNIKNVIKLNKTSIIVISILEMVSSILVMQIIFLPILIVKLIFACISKQS